LAAPQRMNQVYEQNSKENFSRRGSVQLRAANRNPNPELVAHFPTKGKKSGFCWLGIASGGPAIAAGGFALMWELGRFSFAKTEKRNRAQPTEHRGTREQNTPGALAILNGHPG